MFVPPLVALAPINADPAKETGTVAADTANATFHGSPPPLNADPAKEADKAAADPAKYTRRFEGVGRTGTPFAVDVLRERFLGPELFFQPQMYAGGHSGALGEAWGVVAVLLPRECEGWLTYRLHPVC